MKSILEEFARGNIDPEPHFAERNPCYDSTLQQVIASQDKLLAMLNEQQKDALDAFLEIRSKLEDLSSIDRFVHTYRLGVLMTMEAINGKDSI